MLVESVFIGTRVADKRYGPQSRDMGVSEFISLLQPFNRPAQYVLPDFSGLVRHLDNRMRQNFAQQKEDKFYCEYRILSDIWSQTGSIGNPSHRSHRFEKVMDKSMEFLAQSHDVMPEFNPFSLHWDDDKKVDKKGQMYCLALLFHIIARAAYEPASLANDPTLRTHCQWMKDWIKNVLNGKYVDDFSLYTALVRPDYFSVLQHLRGNAESLDVQSYLAGHVREAMKKTSESTNYYHHEWRMSVSYRKFSEADYRMLDVLRDLHYRIDRLELLLIDLATNQVNFDAADEAGLWISEQISRIETDNHSMLTL